MRVMRFFFKNVKIFTLKKKAQDIRSIDTVW